MAIDTNPFVVLSYVSGPALLTNATSLLLLSTTNRFARAIDRSRHLTDIVARQPAGVDLQVEINEIPIVARRIKLIALAIAAMYFAAAMFALATVTSILGAVLAEYLGGATLDVIVGFAVALGGLGFAAFVTGAFALVIETRIVMGALAFESNAAMSALQRARRG
jgi:NAD/NADP transhydrogenase beta subunit